MSLTREIKRAQDRMLAATETQLRRGDAFVRLGGDVMIRAEPAWAAWQAVQTARDAGLRFDHTERRFDGSWVCVAVTDRQEPRELPIGKVPDWVNASLS